MSVLSHSDAQITGYCTSGELIAIAFALMQLLKSNEYYVAFVASLGY